jgi:poly-gamma-glutamate capsule biosynthesis protein CapA/YwtB (metallophosphatase superfamily)
MPRRTRTATSAGVAMAAVVVCALLTEVTVRGSGTGPSERRSSSAPAATADEGPVVTLAFAGDVHFEDELAGVLDDGTSTLGPMSDVLAAADVAMVNLESAVTERGRRADKELEDPSARYWFRTDPRALDVLQRSGVDVASVANNHGADFGLTGLRDTIRADDASAVALLGVGRNDRQAYAPHRVRVRGTDVAIHAADASPRESSDVTWAAAPGTGPGLASAGAAQRDALVAAVTLSARTDDVVVVYLHWGEEGDADPTADQLVTAAALEAAGADVVVGTHAHTPLGAGLRGSTYVSYGLGNFHWYHGRQAESGVLSLAVQDGRVVSDEWVPGRIARAGGGPRPLAGERAAAAVRQWEGLRARTDLAPGPGPSARRVEPSPPGDPLPAFASTVEPIGTSVRRAMRTYDAEACPVPLADLRHLTVTHVGFDGQAHRGELVVADDVAADLVDVFEALYAERFPIERMQLIDDYAGDDDLSMAGNNSSGFNCRRVAGTSTWSDHAYGRAIDINPVQNPYVVGDDVRPPAARAYVSADRSAGAAAAPGVIREGDVVRRELERIGWQWGGFFGDPDYQHFSLPDA